MSSNPFIGFRGTAALNQRLEAAAAREGNRVSAVVRRLLNDALDREENARAQASTPRRNPAKGNAPEAA